jgi:hypothetical protein
MLRSETIQHSEICAKITRESAGKFSKSFNRAGPACNAEIMALKTGEAITLLLLATLAILGLVGIIPWIAVLSFSAWQWDLILSCLALVTNGLLCSMQVVVIFRLGELKSDHINHFDMEKVMRRILVPEQISQARNAHAVSRLSAVPVRFHHSISLLADRLDRPARHQLRVVPRLSAGEAQKHPSIPRRLVPTFAVAVHAQREAGHHRRPRILRRGSTMHAAPMQFRVPPSP